MDFLKIIQEGRVDDFKAKYSQKFGGENINKIISSVPQKYLDWVGKHMDGVNFEDNLSKVSEALNKFVKISSNLPITDLYQYKNVGQLANFCKPDVKSGMRNIKRKISFLSYAGDNDIFFEYLGFIRDFQFTKG